MKRKDDPILRTVHSDCRHYVGDRPCQPHKDHRVICDGCQYYDPVHTRVLIVKLGASGDVLRTTAILGSVKDLYPSSHITWICGKSSAEFIRHTPMIDQPLTLNEESLILLRHAEFDVCINFDLDPLATAITGQVKANVFKGYGRTPRGGVIAYESAGEEWLEMSLWDDKKKANTKTYQSHIRHIIGAPDTNHPIFAPLLPAWMEEAECFAEVNDLIDQPVIGFNVGAGHRWQHKKWTVEGFVQLAELIHQELHARIMVLYGPDDKERANEVIASLSVPFVDAGLHYSMLSFFAVLNLCDIVVTGDTFALHAALGLGKRVVCFVGPTSAAELELYGQGEILQGKIDCLGCYLTRCDKNPYCMELLSTEEVFQSIKKQLQLVDQ